MVSVVVRIMFKQIMDKMFRKHIFATNVLSSGVLMLAGDIIEQSIELHHYDKNRNKYDIPRLGLYTI